MEDLDLCSMSALGQLPGTVARKVIAVTWRWLQQQVGLTNSIHFTGSHVVHDFYAHKRHKIVCKEKQGSKNPTESDDTIE